MGGREAGFAVFLGAAAFAATALTPSSAEACACCGSAESTYVKAWSRDGKRVLLHTNIEATCNRQEYYEVWKIGDGEREYCLDAYAEDPTEHVDCEACGVRAIGEQRGQSRGLAIRRQVPRALERMAIAATGHEVLTWQRSMHNPASSA